MPETKPMAAVLAQARALAMAAACNRIEMEGEERKRRDIGREYEDIEVDGVDRTGNGDGGTCRRPERRQEMEFMRVRERERETQRYRVIEVGGYIRKGERLSK